MFILGNGFLSIQPFNDIVKTPSISSFHKVRIHGGVTLDEAELKLTELSDAEVETHANATTESTYESNTNFLAHFNDSLEAGSFVTGIETPITGYRIRKRVSGSPLNPLLVDILDPTITTYTDYTSKNNVQYTYGVYALFEQESLTIEGGGLEREEEISMWAWILTSEDSPVVTYSFDMNLESSDISINTADQVFESFSKYPTVRKNNLEYSEGKLTTMPYSTNECEYDFSQDALIELVSFLNNGKRKILRNPNGGAYTVATRKASYKYLDEVQHLTDGKKQQPATISFEFIEIDAPPI